MTSEAVAVNVDSRPEQAEHVLAAGQDNYVKTFTYRPPRCCSATGC